MLYGTPGRRFVGIRGTWLSRDFLLLRFQQRLKATAEFVRSVFDLRHDIDAKVCIEIGFFQRRAARVRNLCAIVGDMLIRLTPTGTKSR